MCTGSTMTSLSVRSYFTIKESLRRVFSCSPTYLPAVHRRSILTWTQNSTGNKWHYSSILHPFEMSVWKRSGKRFNSVVQMECPSSGYMLSSPRRSIYCIGKCTITNVHVEIPCVVRDVRGHPAMTSARGWGEGWEKADALLSVGGP